MARADFDSIIKSFTGQIGRLIFRRSHNGKISVYPKPDTTRVKWSKAQKEHRRRMGEASKYASAAIADPEIRAVYVQMALDQNKNPKRPFDTAVSDYYYGGNDLLWKKHMGEKPKPANWELWRYSWYFKEKKRRR